MHPTLPKVFNMTIFHHINNNLLYKYSLQEDISMSLLGFALESSGTPKGYNPLARAGRNAISLTLLHCPILFEELSPTLLGFQHMWGDVHETISLRFGPTSSVTIVQQSTNRAKRLTHQPELIVMPYQ